MERLNELFGGIYNGKKVLITGHTGFKGSWLYYWLKMMGADVYGYALSPTDEINHFDLLDIEYGDSIGDLRDLNKLKLYVEKVKPEIVFHLAAQALVKYSYHDPVDTISTNVMGTLHVFEACRNLKSVKAIINVTSDKCYENKEWVWSYRENDRLGGYDPYSVSKGMSELLTASYRNSFYNLSEYGKTHHVLLASVRAGNVIGGGDWAKDRLLPDLIKSAAFGTAIEIRNPLATRPWQHVLEPLSGYLTLGWKLLEHKKEFAEAWNFGPEIESNMSVGEIALMTKNLWSDIKVNNSNDILSHHEANLLMLDCTKTNKLLKWNSIWDINTTIDKTIHWYKDYYVGNNVNTLNDIYAYIKQANKKNIEWAI